MIPYLHNIVAPMTVLATPHPIRGNILTVLKEALGVVGITTAG